MDKRDFVGVRVHFLLSSLCVGELVNHKAGVGS